MNNESLTYGHETYHTDYSQYVPDAAYLDCGRVRANNTKKIQFIIALVASSCIAVLALTYLFQYVVAFILRSVAPEALSISWLPMLLASFSMYVIGMGGGYLILRRIPVAAPQKKSLSIGHWLIILLICFGMMYTGNIIGVLVNTVISLLTKSAVQNPVNSAISSLPEWAIILTTVIAAPIFEELFFRKLMLDRLKPLGQLPALVVTGVVFGLFHGNLSQLFYATLLGFVLGFVYLKTGNIFHTIALHMTINFCGSIIPLKLIELVQPTLDKFTAMGGAEFDASMLGATDLVALAVYFSYAALVMVVWGAGLVLFFMFIKKYKLNGKQLPLTNGRSSLRVVVTSPFAIAAMLVFVFMIVSSIIPA